MIDQVPNQFVAALLRRPVQRSGTDCIRPIDVGSTLDQQLHRCEAVVAGGVEQGGSPLIVRSVNQAAVPIKD